MGIALWTGCAAAVFLAVRAVPFGRSRRWLRELLIALITAILLGLWATDLDFGGWNEPDWRAGLFVTFGAAAALGVLRAAVLRGGAMSRDDHSVSTPRP